MNRADILLRIKIIRFASLESWKFLIGPGRPLRFAFHRQQSKDDESIGWAWDGEGAKRGGRRKLMNNGVPPPPLI
jgi:hypothetical protein